jgi:hypothetical protein
MRLETVHVFERRQRTRGAYTRERRASVEPKRGVPVKEVALASARLS